VDTLAHDYGMENNEIFKEYIRTLGLRTFPAGGINKLSYYETISQSQVRGFGLFSDVDSNKIPNPDYCFSNFPNPFNPQTTVSFSIFEKSKVELNIYNIKGQMIKTLFQNDYPKGTYYTIWSGDNDFNRKVSSGIYMYKLKVNGRIVDVKKCLMLE